jgi:hypothetical protein
VDQVAEAETVVIADVEGGLADGAGFGDKGDLAGQQRLAVES